MTSSPPSSLQQRQRLHRRQNSTPVAIEAMKVHPATVQRFSQHRRGQSTDSRSPIRRQHRHTGSMVSITNLGSTPHGQQILREAQQQRISRPGQQQQIELPISPQCGGYQPQSNSMSENFYANMATNIPMHTQSMPPQSQFASPNFNLPMSTGMPMSYVIDENDLHYFQSPHALAQDVAAPMQDRRISHPDLRIQTGMRPLTPTQQIQTAHFPLTPAQTPFRAHPQNTRSLQASPKFQMLEEGIRSPRPVSMQKTRSLQGIVEQDEFSLNIPHLNTNSYEVGDMPTPDAYNLMPEPVKQEAPASGRVKKAQAVARSPQEESLPFFDETGGERPNLDDKPIPDFSASDAVQAPLSPTRPALSPRRMSISDLNLDPGISASIEETNITLDDIAQYIDGPDPSDNKWVCRFDDCNKRFGRKENIKSHVQTHLGDRQFRCDHCNKCFVRGHDLKRHAKIHTGSKPYPCLCGNAFNRHDALTRHRQRGMCIGAFEGIVKKVIKRGRPRKHRPEMDERVDKANKSRQSQAATQDHYASSDSSCSMSSWGSPPTESMDALSIQAQSPYDEMNLFGSEFPSQNMSNVLEHVALPPDMFSLTPPASPGFSTGHRPSPGYREISPCDLVGLPEELPTHNLEVSINSASPRQVMPVLDIDATHTNHLMTSNAMVLQHSQQSLPSLSHSSSSPAADIAAFDFGSDDPTMGNMHGMGMNLSMYDHSHGVIKLEMMSGPHERNDFDNFLDFGSAELGMDNNGNDSFFAI